MDYHNQSPSYPKRLKIEIRRNKTNMDFQDSIAFSRFSTHQVLVKALTLEQSMKNKVFAFLDRGEIRDSFDIEFLLRRGIELPCLDQDSLQKFQKKLNKFKQTDFKVKLYIGGRHAQILYFSGICLFEGKTAIPVRNSACSPCPFKVLLFVYHCRTQG